MEVRELYTLEDFEAVISLPENADKLFEYIAGEIVEVPSNPFASKYSMRIGRYLGQFVDDNNLGHVTGEQGGFVVDGERYAPDVAFISIERQPELVKAGYNPNPPELAVEVEVPVTAASERKVNIKIKHYMAARTTLWVFYPEIQQIKVYVPGQQVQILGLGDTLEAESILPGFKLLIDDVFK